MSFTLPRPASLPAISGLAAASALTMSSREIAELVNSRHDKVKQSIERLADRGVIALPPLGEYLDSLGRKATEYRIGKRDSYVIVAQLSPEFTAHLVDRWQQLEAATAAPVVPQSFADALQLAADQQHALEAQRVQIAVLEPKAAALDQIADIGGSHAVTRAAKLLGMPPKELFRFLADNHWIYRVGINGPWTGYQVKIDSGYLVQKLRVVDEQHAFEQVRITRSGLVKLGTLLNANVQLDLLPSAETR
jgi:phage regulator Rha-like protein